MGNSSVIVITVATNSSQLPATLTRQLIGPLEQMLEEVTDINEQISFAIVASERHGMSSKSTSGINNYASHICMQSMMH